MALSCYRTDGWCAGVSAVECIMAKKADGFELKFTRRGSWMGERIAADPIIGVIPAARRVPQYRQQVPEDELSGCRRHGGALSGEGRTPSNIRATRCPDPIRAQTQPSVDGSVHLLKKAASRHALVAELDALRTLVVSTTKPIVEVDRSIPSATQSGVAVSSRRGFALVSLISSPD